MHDFISLLFLLNLNNFAYFKTLFHNKNGRSIFFIPFPK